MNHSVVEVCAGAGGQALGLELAGFTHELLVESDRDACATLRHNRPHWKVAEGDATSVATWDPAGWRGMDLLAGGVPCQPFSVGGKQLGADDERDLLPWLVTTAVVTRPRALLIENVPGLARERFASYLKREVSLLRAVGYVADWRIIESYEFGVPQLRPRFVLVAMRPEDFRRFSWPSGSWFPSLTAGKALLPLMGERGWPGAQAWSHKAGTIAPTLVGGSKKHGGPDLGPSRAKAAWRAMGTDPMGIADQAPPADTPVDIMPRLTCQMAARLQGWDDGDYAWEFPGRKTPVYRQVAQAFPPPVARAVGEAIISALEGKRA